MTLYLEQEQLDALHDEASKKEISVGQLLRELIRSHLRRPR